ncbi:MAG: 3'(2'),5'-bisphosphate nucleotidase CysQ, partial [Polyangiaceae bacterium]|nr:3'(2'),5'-bisphosphate nucleotidase CysQ [Polyangiaceae bacterium]
MTGFDRARAAETALSAALEASALVMDIYGQGFTVEYKAKNDPVTRADRESNQLLCERLTRAFPGVPVIAEESDPTSWGSFAGADAAWFVDPVDGTRELVAHNGEFAVMIGLAERGHATMGVIVAPAWGRAFLGIEGQGAWEVAAGGGRTPIHVSDRATLRDASAVVSRSRANVRVKDALERASAAAPRAHGSSGLKAVLVATGAADLYPQPAPAGMRWDACAGEALVRAAGGECTEIDGRPFEYASGELANARGFLATNGRLHAAAVEALR